MICFASLVTRNVQNPEQLLQTLSETSTNPLWMKEMYYASQTLELINSNKVFVMNFKAISAYETLYGNCTEYLISYKYVYFSSTCIYMFWKIIDCWKPLI